MKHQIKYALDIQMKTSVHERTVTQNDSIEFIITLVKGGEPIDLKNVTPSLAVKRIDGVVTVLDGTVEGNNITFNLGSSETAKPGKTYAVVQLYEGDDRVSSLSFHFIVTADFTAAGFTPSENERTLIEVVLQDGPGVIERATDAASLAERVAAQNETHPRGIYDTEAARDAAIPNPLHGDTATVANEITGISTTYRYVDATLDDTVLKSGWTPTDRLNNPSAIRQLNQQLAEKADYSTLNSTLAIKRDKADPITQNDLSPEVLQAISDTPGVPINVLSQPKQSSVGLPETTFLTTDNLYVYELRSPNNTLQTDGSLYSVTTHDVSDYIPVISGLPYSMTKGSRFVYFYDQNKNFVSAISTTSHQSIPQTITAPATGFIRIAILKEHAESFSVVQSIEPAGIGRALRFKRPLLKAVDNSSYVDRSIDYIKTDFVSVGKNLFNKDAVTKDALLHFTAGGVNSAAGYFTSDFIRLEAKKSYTMNGVRVYNFYGLDKTFSNGVNTGNNNAVVTVTPEHDGYIRVSGLLSSLDNFQLEEGKTPTDYEPYGMVFPQLRLTEKQKREVLGGSPIANDVSLTKSGNTFTLSSKLRDGKEIRISTFDNGSKNGSFNIGATTINGLNVHNINDDITPIRTFYAVGANHGYGVLQVSKSGFTQADLGSQWSDGTRTFTLVKVDGTTLQFAPEYTVAPDGIVSAVNATPAGDLTHVSGASNTETVSVAGHSIQQLYPSIKDIVVRYFVDGKEVSGDGEYKGSEVQVREEYTIMDYKSLIDNAQSNIGVRLNELPIDGIVRLTNVFTYRSGLKCTTQHSLQSLKKVYLGRCGFLQAIRLQASGYSTTRYLHGVKPKDGWDFAKGVDLDQYGVSLVFTHADSKNGTLPPNHYVDWLSNDAGRYVGFALGYIPDKTDTKNAARVSNSPNTWDMRSTDKSYPIALEGVTLEAGQYMSFMGFRNYIAPEEVGNATLITDVADNGNVYTFADFNAANQTYIDTDAGVIGEDIQTVQTQGVKSNESIDLNGMALSSTQAEATGVFKRKK